MGPFLQSNRNNWSSSSSALSRPSHSNGVSNPLFSTPLLPKGHHFPQRLRRFPESSAQSACGLGTLSSDPAFRAIPDETAPPVFGAVQFDDQARTARQHPSPSGLRRLSKASAARHSRSGMAANTQTCLDLAKIYWDPRTAAGLLRRQSVSIRSPARPDPAMPYIGGPTPGGPEYPLSDRGHDPLRGTALGSGGRATHPD